MKKLLSDRSGVRFPSRTPVNTRVCRFGRRVFCWSSNLSSNLEKQKLKPSEIFILTVFLLCQKEDWHTDLV